MCITFGVINFDPASRDKISHFVQHHYFTSIAQQIEQGFKGMQEWKVQQVRKGVEELKEL